MGNGGFVDPITGKFIPAAQAASIAGSMVGNTAANGATAQPQWPRSVRSGHIAGR
jgi:hypothetical protein